MNARALAAATVALLLTFPAFGQPDDPDKFAGATVLCYHIVESPSDPRMEISRETFRQHLQYLEMTGYNVIPLRHLYEYVAGKRPSLPKNAVVITLDDGWRSAYTEAYPELKKRNFPFTLFIYPKIIGKTTISLTWDQIREMAENGADIQSHSLSHPFLTRRMHRSFDEVQYGQWLRRELAESKRIIEKETGQEVEFLAYPYGDYDGRVAKMASKTGYTAALTCDFGRVRPGSDPLRMKRFVIDKKMDFAAFRRYLGATPMQVAEMSPTPGKVVDAPKAVVSARIPDPDSVDPASVGMALLSVGEVKPFSYDAKTGTVSVTLDEPVSELEGWHRAVVWAKDVRSGKRVEATWTFRYGTPEPPKAEPTAVAARLGPPPSGGLPPHSVVNATRESGALHRAAPRK